MRKFVNHKVCVDFDWSHNHTNESNGRSFKIGTVHVQEWNMGKDGEFHRISEKARFMSNKEMKSMVRLSVSVSAMLVSMRQKNIAQE